MPQGNLWTTEELYIFLQEWVEIYRAIEKIKNYAYSFEDAEAFPLSSSLYQIEGVVKEALSNLTACYVNSKQEGK
jgi:hypothetical protein